MLKKYVPDGYANRGRTLEDLIECLVGNITDCVFFRQNNKWVPLEGGRKGAFPAKGAPVDFVGAVRGIPVVLECKEVKKGRKFPLTRQKATKSTRCFFLLYVTKQEEIPGSGKKEGEEVTRVKIGR